MTTYKFGDVVLVAFPFTDHSTTKQRPAVIVSAAAYHQARPDVILMGITSHVRRPTGFGEVVLQEWRSAGLLKPSVIKPVVATVLQQTIRRVLGALVPAEAETLRHMLHSVLFG